jgi:putative ABC transport system ATP-binding protein
MTSTAAVSIEHVTKQYGTGAQAVAALTDVTLAIPIGEFVSIMGPSGSGKSTLLNMIAGLDTPTEGHVRIRGEDLAVLSDDARSDLRLHQIGFIFQSFNLFPGFTVEENIAWPLKFIGIGWRTARDRAAVALQQVGLAAATRTRRPSELSGGEQQRVSIARALITEPSLLLADEPTGNLDTRTGQAILDLILQLNTARKLSVILVTHSTFAATYGHRTVELQDGRVVRDVCAPRQAGRLIPIGA